MNKKQITKDEILQTIKELAESKGRDWLTRKEFLAESGISLHQLNKHFVRWNDAVAQVGLKMLDIRGSPETRKGYSKGELLADIKGVAKKLGRDFLSESEFTAETGITWQPIHRLFGSWEQAVKEAGLNIHPAHKIKIPDIELFQEFFRVTKKFNRIPTYHEFAQLSKHSIGVYENRFGNFTEFRKHALQYGLNNDLIKPEIAQPLIEVFQSKTIHREPSYKIIENRPILGERLDFKGLLHAPVNELGVVYLFGILSDDLGFIVESVQSGFPDCEAKRKLKNNRWQSVRIEFEYKSSHFLEHKHELTKCDIIICWEDDWKDCPIEVLPLKGVVERMKK